MRYQAQFCKSMEPTVTATQGNGYGSSKNMTWKIEAILRALGSITPKRLIVYMAEEAFVVLVVIAAMLMIASLFAIALVLFSEVARFGFLWLKVKVVRIAGLGHDQFAHREAVANASPRGVNTPTSRHS